MVREIQHEGRPIYLCEACGFGYLEKNVAEKCEDFCSTTGSCNIEITKHAVFRGESQD